MSLNELGVNKILDQIERNSVAKCFPAGTLIYLHDSSKIAIEQIGLGKQVLSFDPQFSQGHGSLASKKVVRTFTNITEEWLRLTWTEEG
ncbi:hypothetical protein GFK91_29640 (plasmid) [Roseibium aggregatum]|uniref:hypothetical protein n=1 Tax=Roseibium aggregatum TaxID=187304 RepID=UPI001E45030C|nr:hypothetical protein [Roseibium aggregatum]UES59915.1 hypothetical protein GFK91_29640 [Roseibium aggregatum]